MEEEKSFFNVQKKVKMHILLHLFINAYLFIHLFFPSNTSARAFSQACSLFK